ncbi:unnamed protein product [Effrenium voratum]|nr:unnamed protein product [Effrenium voratum]
MAAPSVQFCGYRQAIGSIAMASLALTVWGGINIVTRLGLVFALVVVYTLFSFYFGLFTVGPENLQGPGSEMITGLSWETFQANWGPHYDEGVHFGVVLSLFYPCFTGILSGANRADVLKDRLMPSFSLFLYSSFFMLWGSVATDDYLKGNFLEHGRRRISKRFSALGLRSRTAWQSEVVWNPFPNSAFIGIIIASLSQSLQCLIVAPRLLQNMAKDWRTGFKFPWRLETPFWGTVFFFLGREAKRLPSVGVVLIPVLGAVSNAKKRGKNHQFLVGHLF